MARKRGLNDAELEELVMESDFDENVSELEDSDYEVVHDHPESSDSFEDLDDAENNSNRNQQSHQQVALTTIISKDGNIIWNTVPGSYQGRVTSANVIKTVSGPTTYSKARVTDIKSTFSLLFPPGIIKVIIDMTNVEGKKVFGDKWENLDYLDIEAYFGLLLLAGVYKSHGEAVKSLWNEEFGRPIFRATMSLERFVNITRVLRFDNRDDRPERRVKDKLAAIRVLWDKWVENLPKLYNPGQNVTVDEQLVSFRGRCPFKQYIPNKPAKYGVKIWAVCDSVSCYAWNMQVYTGKLEGEKPEKNQGMRVVLDLTYGLQGQNITCDNFFTSYALGQMLLKRKMTMLGTIRRNKPELPVEVVNSKKVEVHSSRFIFTKDATVVSYIPKKNKVVLLMSTMHHTANISIREDKKPQIILDYNATKGAVDTLDKLVATYTCKRATARWPMVIFHNMLDVSAYNSFVIWREINPEWNENKLYKRRLYLEQLGKDLIQAHIIRRTSLPRGSTALQVVRSFQNTSEEAEPPTTEKKNKRGRCNVCPRKNDVKTNMNCYLCQKYLCKQHVDFVCSTCKNK